MGWRFRKQFGSGGVRGSISKHGMGISWGIPGLRFGVSPTGRRFVSISIPGTGLYWIKYFGDEKKTRSSASAPPPITPSPSKPIQNPSTTTPWWKQPP
jgi:hypothetical protein